MRVGWVRSQGVPALCALLVLVCVLSGCAAAAAQLPPTWTSGAGTSDPRAFGSWRGNDVDVWVTWNDAPTWSEMEKLYTLKRFSKPNRFPGRMSFAQPLLDKNSNFGECSRGAYDQHFRNVAEGLRSQGWDGAFVRLGWEMNGNWYKWGVGSDYEGFIACFRRAATAFKSVSPRFVVEWNPAATQTQSSAARSWPGDEFVDVIGGDFYDGYPAATTPEQWNAKCSEGSAQEPIGLCRLAEFARDHGKSLSVPEWGLRVESKLGTTDNPLFVRRMYEFFQANRDILAYEAYFDLQGPRFEISHGQNVAAGREYQKLWRAD